MDEVFLVRSVRQCVLLIPKRLRYFLQRYPTALGTAEADRHPAVGEAVAVIAVEGLPGRTHSGLGRNVVVEIAWLIGRGCSRKGEPSW